MDTTALLFLLVVVGVLVIILQLLILVFLSRGRLKLEDEASELVDETKTKSHSIIHRAIAEANRIMVNAELKGIRMLARGKLTGKDLTQQYRENLARIEVALREQFAQSATKAEASYQDFIKLIEATINEQISRNQKLIEEKADQMVRQSQTQVSRLIGDIHAKVKTQVDAEMQAAKNEIAQYKSSRIAVLDERIVDILEEILRVALAKKLSLADQSDLIYKALEQAKHENAFEAVVKPKLKTNQPNE